MVLRLSVSGVPELPVPGGIVRLTREGDFPGLANVLLRAKARATNTQRT